MITTLNSKNQKHRADLPAISGAIEREYGVKGVSCTIETDDESHGTLTLQYAGVQASRSVFVDDYETTWSLGLLVLCALDMAKHEMREALK